MMDTSMDTTTQKDSGHILIVDDEKPICLALRHILSPRGHQVTQAHDGTTALQILSEQGERFDLIMLDIRMPRPDGLTLLKTIKERHPHVSVLMMTGYGSVNTAVDALKLGALDYLSKPFDDIFKLCEEVIPHAIAQTRLARSSVQEGALVSLTLERSGGVFEGMVGRSKPMQRVYEMISGVAPTDAPVLIHGETGTGKELVARAIHARSERAKGPFVPVNCAALPSELLESELFGHERGAFTGATRDKPGLFEVAHKGTLFLDEIAEIPIDLQPKLLRVLESGELRRVGSERVRQVDVRICAASHASLREQVRQRRFREDLYYRLAVVTIDVPALRERGDDVTLLAQRFLEDYAQRTGRPVAHMEPDAVEMLNRHEWPGNVRELRNVIERTLIFTRGLAIHMLDLPEEFHDASRPQAAPPVEDLTHLHFNQAKQRAVQAFEEVYLRAILERTAGNISQAAREAGMDRSNFRRLLKKLDMDYA